jgi:preprotein translocase subunit SecE
MANEEEKKEETTESSETDETEESALASSEEPEERVVLDSTVEHKPIVETRPDDDGPAPNAPVQLGYRRYVFAAYMAAAIAVAFLSTKVIDYAWFKTAQWKPEWFGQYVEPQDEAVVILGGVIGVAFAIYYWRNKKVRTLIEEIAEELTRVTWPTRQEVTNSTTVVIIATTFATLFFALMDQFWLWVTKHVYGS